MLTCKHIYKKRNMPQALEELWSSKKKSDHVIIRRKCLIRKHNILKRPVHFKT